MLRALKKVPIKFDSNVRLSPEIRQTLSEWSAYLRPWLKKPVRVSAREYDGKSLDIIDAAQFRLLHFDQKFLPVTGMLKQDILAKSRAVSARTNNADEQILVGEINTMMKKIDRRFRGPFAWRGSSNPLADVANKIEANALIQ